MAPLRVDVEVGPGAHACLTTPSALTKVYRTAGEPAAQAVRLVVAPGATLEWVPDHTIPFAGSDFRQSIEAEVAERRLPGAGGRVLGGALAAGERWRFRRLESALTGARSPRRGRARPLRAGRSRGPPRRHRGRGLLRHAVVVAGRGLDALAEEVPAWRPPPPASWAAGGRLDAGALVVRCLAPSAPVLLDALGRLWDATRKLVVGAPPRARKLDAAAAGAALALGHGRRLADREDDGHARITKLRPVGGFCAAAAGAVTLIGTAVAGIPVSTTQTISGARMGVGALQRLSRCGGAWRAVSCGRGS